MTMLLNRPNLAQLATYLEGLPADYSHFHMKYYLNNKDSCVPPDGNANYALHNGGVDQFGCGAVACAVGHGPAAGLLMDARFVTRLGIHWTTYAHAAFGADAYGFCFDSSWAGWDNSHQGAAARIRYLLENEEKIDMAFDGPDEDWVEAYASFRKDYSDA